MQMPIKVTIRTQAGYALLVTLCFVAVALMIFASTMVWIASSNKVTQRNNLYNVSEAAAQAAIEQAIGQMARDFRYQTLNDPGVYEALVANIPQTNWPVHFLFSDAVGITNQISVSVTPQNWSTNWVPLDSQYSGLYGAAAQCTVTAVATPLNQGYDMSAKVSETLQMAAIPIFQYGAFYNMDLEIGNGQPMNFNGKVHCNGIIWMCPMALATFYNVVEASRWVTNADNPNDQQNHSFNKNNLKYVSLPSGNPLSGVDSLTLPVNGNSTNAEAVLNLPPDGLGIPNDSAYLSTNQVYLYNECDLIISNAPTGINGSSSWGSNLFVYYSAAKNTALAPGRLSLVTNDLQWISPNVTSNKVKSTWIYTTNSYTTNCCYSFVTNVTFYDFREEKTVQAVQIDISKLNIWLTNRLTRTNNDGTTNYVAGYYWNWINGGDYGMGGSALNTGEKGHPIDSIYVYNSVPLTGATLPAVRVANGTNLPSRWGLTVATPMPLYTLGNYNIQTNNGGNKSFGTTNTSWTWPAALMGDSISILSTNWNDANYIPGNAYGTRQAVSTTVNAACFEGIVPSVKVNGNKHYSGGLENFLRLIEDWSNGSRLTYNGSIVVMFPSIYATNYWSGTYYGVPTRQWGFDANFTDQSKLPPCTPQIKGVIRGTWSAQ